MLAEIGAYAFWGFFMWAIIALTGYLLYYLQLRIRTRQEALNRLAVMRVQLAEMIVACEKDRKAYETSKGIYDRMLENYICNSCNSPHIH